METPNIGTNDVRWKDFYRVAGAMALLILLAGLAGFGFTSIFFIIAAFVPSRFDLAMIFAMFGGLSLLAYQIMLVLRFFHLAG
jgi:hypothetical protein